MCAFSQAEQDLEKVVEEIQGEEARQVSFQSIRSRDTRLVVWVFVDRAGLKVRSQHCDDVHIHLHRRLHCDDVHIRLHCDGVHIRNLYGVHLQSTRQMTFTHLSLQSTRQMTFTHILLQFTRQMT
jgi:hypothetical protein